MHQSINQETKKIAKKNLIKMVFFINGDYINKLKCMAEGGEGGKRKAKMELGALLKKFAIACRIIILFGKYYLP